MGLKVGLSALSFKVYSINCSGIRLFLFHKIPFSEAISAKFCVSSLEMPSELCRLFSMLCVSYLAFLFLSITPGFHLVKVSLDCRPWQWFIYILDNVPNWLSLPRKEFSNPLQLSSMVSGFKSFDVDEVVSAFLHFKNLPDCWVGYLW